MKFLSSLNTRLVLSHLLVSLISIILISAFAARSIFDAARYDFESSVDDQASFIRYKIDSESLFERYLANEPLDNGKTVDAEYLRGKLLNYLNDYPTYGFTLYRVTGVPITDKADAPPPKATRARAPEVLDAYNGDLGKGRQIRVDENGEQRLYVAMRIMKEAELLGFLRISAPLEPALAPARRSLALLLLVALVVASLVSWFAWLLANSLSRPIQQLTEAADQMAAGNLSIRVTPQGTQELYRLAETFNTMAGRIKNHMDELRAFVANASHELRTPWTVVKLRAEALSDGAMEDPTVAAQFLEDIQNEVNRLVRMVNDLLDLSRMEAGLASTQRSQINLGLVAAEVFETFKIRAARAEVQLRLDIEPGRHIIVGNEDQIRRVLYNLVENAIKYAPNGQISLMIRSDEQQKTVQILVRDDGPGIPEEHLSHVFERFYRAETTRPRADPHRGSGLGLAIAKSIVEIHAGEIGVNSQLGVGSTFWIKLPAAEQPEIH